MIPPPLSFETVHATCVMVSGVGVLLQGRSGSGKSDLALRLLDRGHQLVSDDYTIVRRDEGNVLIASAPPNIAGKIEVRGVGIFYHDFVSEARLGLIILLDEPPVRLPASPPEMRFVAEAMLPAIALPPFEASAARKVELAVARFGDLR
jgi:serine kinase of HPr protein (carbohydrate metabolism regulator)